MASAATVVYPVTRRQGSLGARALRDNRDEALDDAALATWLAAVAAATPTPWPCSTARPAPG